ITGGARRDPHRLEASGPRLESKHDLADIARDDGVDVILIRCPLERAHRFRGGRVIVIRDNLDLAAVDPACGVDLVGCKLGGERDRRAGDSLRFSNDADFDGVFRLRVCGRCECKRKEGHTCRKHREHWRGRGAPLKLTHCHSSLKSCNHLLRDDRLLPVYPIIHGWQARFWRSTLIRWVHDKTTGCINIPASRQASGADLPCTINTSIWGSSVTICSALNLFFGMTQAPFQAHFLTTLGLKKPGQVNLSLRNSMPSISVNSRTPKIRARVT